MSWNSNLHNKTALPAGLVVVPSEAYRCPRKQHCIKLKPPVYFSADGSLGAPLSIIFSETSAQQSRLDEPDTPLFEGCSTRVTFVISIPGFRPFRVQKYLGSRHHGIPVASNRRKIFHQVAEAMEAFLQYIQHERHGTLFSENSGIRLDDLYLLEVRHVAKASFQPIFAVKEGYALRGWVHSIYPTPPQYPPVVTRDEDTQYFGSIVRPNELASGSIDSLFWTDPTK